ncbi:hypothetical protein BV898_15708 [Hypsibius exemplaris]|uniref:UPAR/Ly6 domain-containing protein n=1 Tax=Hypsibius exemplaris TaxID=2072580 RepID=A0A9X6RKH1_HYPEX|nr:hypothetical protein BV898_15708 [Hypsibius exemplaris]
MVRTGISPVFVFLSIGFFVQGAFALQCFVCTANRFLNKDCRSLSAARLIDCPDTSTHCNAIVTDIDGMLTVNRGCSGNVFSWGFGNDECEIMTNERIIDRAVAFYQCRGDGCNNIEPGQVTTVDKVLANRSRARVPQFAMASQMQSEHTMQVGDSNLVAGSRAIVSDQETGMRMGKQAADSADDSDDSYGLPGRERRTRARTTTTTTTPTTTTTTATTTTTTTTPAPRIVVATTTPAPITRPPPKRKFTVFD